jgi:hypothetical protein
MKLEIGKIYLTRGNSKVRLEGNVYNPRYPFKGIFIDQVDGGVDWVSYSPSGKYDLRDSEENDFDLVSEYIEPKPVEKCLFEVGKTYKDARGSDIKIIYIRTTTSPERDYPVLGVWGPDEVLFSYTLEGRFDRHYTSFDLIPPTPPLPIVIGGFYLDDQNIVRVLCKSPKGLFAPPVSTTENQIFSWALGEFPKSSPLSYPFTLVKLLTQEEVQNAISS